MYIRTSTPHAQISLILNLVEDSSPTKWRLHCVHCSDMDSSFELESTVAEKINEQYREILRNKPSTYIPILLMLNH